MSAADSAAPQQLGDWIESLLSKIEKRFDEQNNQVVDRSKYRMWLRAYDSE